MKYMLLFSAGLDSTVLFYDLLSRDERFECMFVDYGQKNAIQEQQAAQTICLRNFIRLHTIKVPLVFEGVKSTLLKNVEGEHTVESDEIINRNAVLINIAAAHCTEPTTILVAAHKTGAAYADATRMFYSRMARAVSYSTSGMVSVEAPYIKLTKPQIVKKAWGLALSPAELLETVSCYEGNQCGRCPACKSRREAFYNTPYQNILNL